MPSNHKSILPPAGHPFWAFANTVAVCAFVTLYSYINAEHFDATEIRLILYSTLTWIGMELIKSRRPNSMP